MKAPLEVMSIRNIYTDDRYRSMKGIKLGNLIKQPFGGTFGKDVRTKDEKHPKPHQGWDLYAKPGTEAFAINDGTVVRAQRFHGFGRSLMLEFDWSGSELVPEGTLYAFYAHLSEFCASKGDEVKEGDVIAKTGVDGNAEGGPPHLHFGISTLDVPSKGVVHWIDPGEILGYLYLNVDQLLIPKHPRSDGKVTV